MKTSFVISSAIKPKQKVGFVQKKQVSNQQVTEQLLSDGSLNSKRYAGTQTGVEATVKIRKLK